MKNRLLVGSLLLALSMPASVAAQGGEGRGSLWEVQTLSVMPADVPAFTETVQQVAKAAGLAQLSEDYWWTLWSDFPNFVVVSPVKNFADFDDPEAWMRQYQGTPGEQAVGEAMQRFEGLHFKSTSREVIEAVLGWTYMPASGTWQPGGAHVASYWLKPDMNEEFDALAKDFIGFLQELEAPYQVSGYRIHFGDPGRVDFITFYDTQEAFYGRNSIEAIVERKGEAAQQKYSELVGRFLGMVENVEDYDAAYEAEMSYWPGT